MKAFLGLLFRALAILLLWGCVGGLVNVFSARAIPWVYVPPKQVELSGVKVPLVNEKAAREMFDDPSTVFLDTRTAADFAKASVKGALSLPRKEMEERFPRIQPLLTEENRLVLFCYGPECEDAERVAEFLIPMGYRNLVIMSPGFPAWKAAGYPVESSLGGAPPSGEPREGAKDAGDR